VKGQHRRRAFRKARRSGRNEEAGAGADEEKRRGEVRRSEIEQEKGAGRGLSW
jgi:hypothetical protein